jgi:RNA-directed DNA polymerase
VRYADDAIIVCQDQDDAKRVLNVLPKRFGRFGLTLHPDKTRLVGFVRPATSFMDDRRMPPSSDKEPESFDFLGFTFYWGRTRKGGRAVTRKTAKDRLARAIARVTAWCREHRHEPIREQHQTLYRAVQGHYAYYGVTGNGRQIARFVRKVEEVWRTWLARRSDSAKYTWSWFATILKRFPLPPPRIVHKYA